MSDIPHPEWRDFPFPSRNQSAKTNPPCLLWPAAKNSAHEIRLSRDSLFPSAKTKEFVSRDGCIMMVPEELNPGQWFWQYKRAGTDWDGAVHSFFIQKEDCRSAATPEEIIKRSRNLARPRKLLPSCSREDLRSRASRPFLIREKECLIEEAEAQLGLSIPGEEEIRASIPAGEPWQEEMLLERATKIPAHERLVSLHQLLQAWLLTGKAVYLETSLDWGRDIICRWKDEGIFSRNDFAASAALAMITLIYDTAYDYLSEEEKRRYRNKILIWGERIYQTYVCRVEARVMENHAWQHILRRLAFAGLALAGEEEQGEKWLSYVYQVWTARFPILGGDGGWANGNGYFPVNYESIVYLSALFSQLSGREYLDVDWFTALPGYLSLTMPPESAGDYFGDNGEKYCRPPKDTIGFAHAMGLLLDDSSFHDYARNCLDRQSRTLEEDKKFRWFRLAHQREAIGKGPARPLSATGLFGDIGLAVFHGGEQMISFRSSPYGSFGHAHADQNGFNINKKGIPLFVKAGYYTSFADPHNFQVYRHSWGQNTILPSGFCQRLGTEGSGRIVNFGSEEGIHWVSGDASCAYGPPVSEFWLKRMERAGIEPTAEFSFGDPRVTKFFRTLLFLESHTLIIYDDLESNDEICWDYHLHSPHCLAGEGLVTCGHPAGDVTFEVRGSSDLHSEISTVFPVRPQSVKRPEGYPDQWHYICRNRKKSRSFRYLTIMNFSQNTKFDCNRIYAELNTNKHAKLSIKWGEEEKHIYG